MPQAPYTVLVNSSDGFTDCWPAFFTLFRKYWPDCPAPVLLNTERATFSFDGVPVTCTRVQGDASERLSWSDCLLGALRQVKTPLVLYLQEDYFFERPVRTDLIAAFAEKMLAHPDIKHIGLTHFGTQGPFTPTDDDRLWLIDQRANYRLCTQAGLWRPETLASHLVPGENGWSFEILGSYRARKRHETFLTVNRDRFNPQGEPVFTYTHTGIVKGRWHPAMPRLFAANGIEMDFARRGFYKPAPRYIEHTRTLRKLLRHPIQLIQVLSGR